jgi:hypothetical protein
MTEVFLKEYMKALAAAKQLDRVPISSILARLQGLPGIAITDTRTCSRC